MKTPEMVSGKLPLIGHLVDYISRQDDLLRRGARECGEVFGLSLQGQPVAVLTGDQAKGVFFQETDRSLNMNEAYDFLAAIFGEVVFWPNTIPI